MISQCYFCYIKSIEKLIAKCNPNDETAIDLIFKVNKLLNDNRNLTSPYLVTEIQRLAKKYLKTDDFYQKEKDHANTLLLHNYDYWKNMVTVSKNPFQNAAKLAVIGNIIDYGAHCVAEDINQQIENLFKLKLKKDESSELFKQVKKAKSILYLGDNTGEIVFDKLFIEQINHPNLTFAVRGKPVLNDATLQDAHLVGINHVCKVISNGYDAPSTLVEYCSEEFKNIYNSSDLIISKGQGNFEGLMNSTNQNTFFMLIAKCEPIAELLGVSKNDMVITKYTNKNHLNG